MSKTASMSKSTLVTEVEALQGNTAFISEFLDVPIFDLGTKEHVQADALQQRSEKEIAPPPTNVAETAAPQRIEQAPVIETVTPAVLPKVVMPKVAVSLPVKRTFDGKYVIWTPGKPTASERVLIKKIIEAVHIPAASLVLENDINVDASDWSTATFVFAFGITAAPGAIHQLSEWQGTRLLKICSLAELDADLNQKKALWAALKLAFKL